MHKFAVSNIAWTSHDDPAIFALLQKYGVAGIEIAPSKIWPQWIGASQASAAEYRKRLADRGFCVPAMQSLLFGIPNLSVFDESSHARFLEHMKLVAEIAEGLGAKVLVFGSPKNRRRGHETALENVLVHVFAEEPPREPPVHVRVPADDWPVVEKIPAEIGDDDMLGGLLLVAV